MAKQHGAEAHLLRVDRVWRTGVIDPTVGYEPVAASQAVAARFVAPVGLAGTQATRHRLAGPVEAFPGKVATFFAGIRARWEARRLARQVARNGGVPFAPGAQTMTLDTSPRGPSPGAGAIAVQSGWMPQPQSPASAVANLTTARAGDPPMPGIAATAAAMTPESTWPNNYWRDVISQDVPPIIAARGGGDALYKWYRRGRS